MENFKSAEFNSSEQISKTIEEKTTQLNIPIFNEENIDERLSDKPYFTHAIMVDPLKLTKILETGKLLSSKKSSAASMTYEIDKLMGMDENVFFALGKGYMGKSNYGLIFNTETMASMPGANFIEDDLMNIGGEIIEEFLEKHKEEMIVVISQKRDALKELFEKKVIHAFQGGHGIYEQYFGEQGGDRIEDFLDAIKSKGFKGISAEEEVVNQFTIERDTILSEEIMPRELRDELIKLLQNKVVASHTIVGEKNIQDAISLCWQNDSVSYRKFLQDGENVPKKVTELRIPDELDIKKAIIGIYFPKK